MTSTATRNLHLTTRDNEIILMVYHYDGLVSHQIRRRFWPGFGRSTAFFSRLSRLVDAGFLRRKQLESPTGKGSGPGLITLGKASHPILLAQLGLTGSDLRRLRHSYIPSFWRHEKEVRDFRLTLELSCARSDQVDLDGWVNEADLRRSPWKVKVGSAAVELVPDGTFTLRQGERWKTYFLELDRDTEKSPQLWRTRAKAYLTLIGGNSTPVLIVVPHRKRLERVARWIRQAAAELGASSSIFALTTSDQVGEQTILHAPIWQLVNQAGSSPLVPRPQEIAHEGREQPRSRAELLFGGEIAGA